MRVQNLLRGVFGFGVCVILSGSMLVRAKDSEARELPMEYYVCT